MTIMDVMDAAIQAVLRNNNSCVYGVTVMSAVHGALREGFGCERLLTFSSCGL